MSKGRMELKVGLFVLISLIFVAVLIMKFSKGSLFFEDSYRLQLRTSNVGGIRPGAAVLMAGVRIGHISEVDLKRGGRSVTMTAKILSGNVIFTNSVFTIEQAGFLGDQYVSVIPLVQSGEVLSDGDAVDCEPPFNIQEVARAGAGLLEQFEGTAARLDRAVGRMSDTLFSERTLNSVTGAVYNFEAFSERALSALRGVDTLVQTNEGSLRVTVSNLVTFSERLKEASGELHEILTTNRSHLAATLEHFESASASVDQVLQRVEAGEGLAGNLLMNDRMAEDFRAVVENMRLLSSNLTRHGLLWKPRGPRPELPGPLYPGKTPFDR